ncbi:MAG: hypothetical protein ACSLEL_01805 [Candidatus Malihini olakiniferum]
MTPRFNTPLSMPVALNFSDNVGWSSKGSSQQGKVGLLTDLKTYRHAVALSAGDAAPAGGQ